MTGRETERVSKVSKVSKVNRLGFPFFFHIRYSYIYILHHFCDLYLSQWTNHESRRREQLLVLQDMLNYQLKSRNQLFRSQNQQQNNRQRHGRNWKRVEMRLCQELMTKLVTLHAYM